MILNDYKQILVGKRLDHPSGYWQMPQGGIDDKENPLVKIKFSGESKQLLQGQELHIAKEMIRAGIESISGNVSDFDEFFDSQLDNIKKKEVTLH